MFAGLGRVIKSGFVGFVRSGWLSLATIFIMVLMLFVLVGLGLLVRSANYLLATLQDHVDVSVYLLPATDEAQILRMKAQIEKVAEVKSVEYVSREEALKRFRERHKDNAVIIESLQELGENPLEASLNIRAHEAGQFEAIAKFLENPNYKKHIDKINYSQVKDAIKKLAGIIAAVRRGGLILVGVLGIIAVLVSFNTVRLAMYAMREEIGVMRLVGASNWFIRGPFLVEGILYGILASVITLALYVPILKYASPQLDQLLPGLRLFEYYRSALWMFAAGTIGVSALLGVISSAIAIRRYLKV